MVHLTTAGRVLVSCPPTLWWWKMSLHFTISFCVFAISLAFCDFSLRFSDFLCISAISFAFLQFLLSFCDFFCNFPSVLLYNSSELSVSWIVFLFSFGMCCFLFNVTFVLLPSHSFSAFGIFSCSSFGITYVLHCCFYGLVIF